MSIHPVIIEADPKPRSPFEVVPAAERQFGRYALLCRLASGGMASLYLARAVGPDGFEKQVAIKRIHEHLAEDADFVTMFVDEARLAARITHPNVVQVLELGQVGRSLFMAMEYLEGESLAQLVKRTTVPLPVCARIISQAAMGLHAAHELRDNQGQPLDVVHRDVSPQNVLIGYDGAVKVVDFGVAKASSNAATTRAGTVKGKFSYMAPEQLKPDTFGEVTRRADIFSLGILLFEATTRRRLFKGESDAETIEQVLTKDVPPPSLYVRDYPEMPKLICMRALERQQDFRFQTAQEMHEALETYLSSCPTPMLPGTIADLMHETFAEERTLKSSVVRQCLAEATGTQPSYSVMSTVGSASGEIMRRRKVALALGSVLLALGLVAGLLYSSLRQPPPPRPVAVPSIPDARPRLVRVVIRAAPLGATIRFDGKVVQNPFELRGRPEKRQVQVDVSAPEHRPQSFSVGLEEGGRWTIALERLPGKAPDAGKLVRRPRRPRLKRHPSPKTKTKQVINNLFTNPYNQ